MSLLLGELGVIQKKEQRNKYVLCVYLLPWAGRWLCADTGIMCPVHLPISLFPHGGGCSWLISVIAGGSFVTWFGGGQFLRLVFPAKEGELFYYVIKQHLFGI